MTKDQLAQTIMRRVYYAYSIRLVAHPVTLHGVMLCALAFTLTYFVSVTNVLENVMHIEVQRVGGYFVEALLHTEVWTLLILGGITFTVFSLRLHLRRPSIQHSAVHA